MNHKDRSAKRQRAHQHRTSQASKLKEALETCRAKAKKQRKGPKFVAEQMEKLGYVPNGNGGFRRLHERSMERARLRSEKTEQRQRGTSQEEKAA